jgi:hypothetical protein
MRLAGGLALFGALACSQTTELLLPPAPGSDAATDTSSLCPGPVAAIHIGGFDNASCAGAIAARVGRYAICSCFGFTLMPGGLTVQSAPGTVPGAVGAEGQVLIFGVTSLNGTLVASTAGGIGLASGTILGNLRSGGTVGALGIMSVGGDVYSAAIGGPGGGFTVAGQYTIGGALHAPLSAQIDPQVSYARLLREPVFVPPPCGCNAGPPLNIAGAVSARSVTNDNASSPSVSAFLAQIDANQTFDWSCGQFYLSQIRTGPLASIEFRIHGQVGIFVDGDVSLGNNLNVSLDPGAELDLVVAGSFSTRGPAFGSQTAPAKVRLWVGSNTVSVLSDQVQLGTLLYAPQAAFSAGKGLMVNGSLFVRTLSTTGDVRMTYDAAAAAGGQTCGIAPPPLVQ